MRALLRSKMIPSIAGGVLVLAACNLVRSDQGDVDARSVMLDCPTYCSEIQTNCTGANAEYPDRGHCLGSCASFGPGTLGDMSGNTLGAASIMPVLPR
jgi:hypothetical protein